MGTRLRPLTLVRPKPLVPVCLRPLAAHAFDHLAAHGIGRYVVNTHWLPGAWAAEFPEGTYRHAEIHFRHEPEILETAGGIKNVEDLLGDDTFAVYNGDILTDLPLAPAIREHRASGNEVTMVLRSKDGPLQVALQGGRIADIGDKLGAAPGPRYLFTGIYLVEPAFLRRIPAGEKIGVVRIFLAMIKTGAKLGGIVIDDGHWWDLGTREKYLEVHRHFAAQDGAPWISPTASLGKNAAISGASAIGDSARIGRGAKVVDSVVWPGAEILPGAELRDCIVTGREPVAGLHTGADL